jgi:outer membrane translocation and assembly module TamA
VVVEGELKPELNAAETRLVCGEREGNDPRAAAWRHIPHAQARFHLRNFLQDRGLFHPVFERTEDGALLVRTGPTTRVRSVSAEGAPGVLELGRRRIWLGARLTPSLLTDAEKWITRELRAGSYPCPSVRATGDPDTGDVVAAVEPGRALRIASVLEEPLPGLRPGLLRRYDAFRAGDPFNGDRVAMTERRAIAEGVVQSLHFAIECTPEGAVLRQTALLDPPRALTVGFGVNTEGLFVVKASWRDTRLGKNASLIDVTALASALEQLLDASVTWYPLPYPSRRFVRPLVSLRHQDEEPFEAVTAHAELAGGTSWDGRNLGLRAIVGPAWDDVRTLRGTGPPSVRLVSLDFELRLMSHAFELHRASPRAGFVATLSTSLNDENVLSDVTAQRLRLVGEGLWNLRGLDPPQLILGARGGAATTVTEERTGPATDLPPSLRHYLGGSLDLRGFGRTELPLGGLGGLASAFVGLEVRWAGDLPWGLHPFAFLDVGALGSEPLELDMPLFWSPGLGVRWESPIGVFRSTFAHGFVTGGAQPEVSHPQFYFSYAEEF